MPDNDVEITGLFTKNVEPEPEPTPVSDIADPSDDVKVWSFGTTVFIESVPGSRYEIFNLNGSSIVKSPSQSTHEQISISKDGIYIVVVNNKSYKVIIQH